MGADLYIHIFEGLEENDLKVFFTNTMGSKWFALTRYPEKKQERVRDRVLDTTSVWIGSVSWLKAGLFDDNETFIPDTVDVISDLVGEELSVLTDELIVKILDAFDLENKTGYELNTKEDVAKFLNTHKGKRVFKISH